METARELDSVEKEITFTVDIKLEKEKWTEGNKIVGE